MYYRADGEKEESEHQMKYITLKLTQDQAMAISDALTGVYTDKYTDSAKLNTSYDEKKNAFVERLQDKINNAIYKSRVS